MKKLLSSYPHLVKEWHPTNNGDLTPNDITHGVEKKFGGFVLKDTLISQGLGIEQLRRVVVLIVLTNHLSPRLDYFLN